MIRDTWRFATVATMLLLLPEAASAQATPAPNRAVVKTDSALGAYDAPGNYGVAWGSASFGLPRLHSAYSTSYGPGYGYGYAPSRFLPGAFGQGLWSPSSTVAPGSLEGSGYYRVFPVPYGPAPHGAVPPLGAYAPAFGPPAFQRQGR